MSRSHLCLWMVMLAGAGAACHRRPPVIAPSRSASIVETSRSPTPAPPARPPAILAPRPPAAVSAEEEFLRKSLDQLNAEHPLADVFFDYDVATVCRRAGARWSGMRPGF